MPKKDAKYIVQSDLTEIEIRFYRQYDALALINKVLALKHVSDRQEEFREQISAREELAAFTIDDRYFDSLRAEIYLTEYHQFEAFLALLIAPFKGLPTWIFLTAYRPGEMFVAARSYLKNDIKSLTNGCFDQKSDFLKYALYTLVQPSEQELIDRWDENIANAEWLVDRMAQRYIDGLDAYNAYKHGLRVLTGSSTFTFRLESSPGGPVESVIDQIASPDSLTFLEIQSTPEGDKVVHETTRHVNPGIAILYVSRMAAMAETMRRTRLFHFDGTPVGNLHTFFSLDKDWVIALETERMFQFKRTL